MLLVIELERRVRRDLGDQLGAVEEECRSREVITVLAVDQKLVEIVEKTDLVTLVGCNLRFHPVLERVRSIIEDGRLGDVTSFSAYCGSYLPGWSSNDDRDYRETYSARRDQGGGVVLDMIHELDYCYWLFGDVIAVDGYVGQVSQLDVETEDLAELVLRTRGDTVGNVHLDYYRPEDRRTLEVIGTRGTLHADLIDDVLEVSIGDDYTETMFEHDANQDYRNQLRYFLEHVHAGRECENDIREGKRVLEIALEAKAGSGY